MHAFCRSVVAAALVLSATPPAAAQSAAFYRQQLGAALRDLERITIEINNLGDQIHGVTDRARGCSLLRSRIYQLERGHIEDERVAGYAAQLGDDELHRAAVDQHNGFLAARKDSENSYAVNRCEELG